MSDVLIKPAELGLIIQLLSASGHVRVCVCSHMHVYKYMCVYVCAADRIYVQQALGLSLILQDSLFRSLWMFIDYLLISVDFRCSPEFEDLI